MKVIEKNVITGEITERAYTSEELANIAACKPTLTQLNAEATEKLSIIDKKKVRAISDMLLTGDKTKLQALEEEAVAVRATLVSYKGTASSYSPPASANEVANA